MWHVTHTPKYVIYIHKHELDMLIYEIVLINNSFYIYVVNICTYIAFAYGLIFPGFMQNCINLTWAKQVVVMILKLFASAKYHPWKSKWTLKHLIVK